MRKFGLQQDKVFVQRTIYETKDFGKFVPLDGQPENRAAKINDNFIADILKTGGNIVPIIVTENTNMVIDGNRRLAACKTADVPVRYEYVASNNKAALDLMKMVNSHNKPWNKYDFIEFYAYGYELKKYLELHKFMAHARTPFEVIQILSSGITSEDVVRGNDFNINYIALEEKILIVQKLRIAVGIKRAPGQTIIARSFSRIDFEKVDIDVLVERVARNIDRVLKQLTMNKISGPIEFASIMQKCYNWGVAKGSKVRFVDDL